MRNKNNDKVTLLRKALDSKVACGISIYAYTEVLQGAKSKKEFEILERHLSAFTIYYLPSNTESYAASAKLFLELRNKGKTIRSTIDILIAKTAISNGLYLLHNDHDFDVMAENITDLKVYK